MDTRLPKYRAPNHPGEILNEEFLKPMGISQTAFALHIGCTRTAINEIIRGKRGVTPEMACKIADALGTSVGLWAGLQSDYDLHLAIQHHQKLPKIKVKKTS